MDSCACGGYQEFYSSLMNITIALFSLTGISIFYFWQQHNERRNKITAIQRVMPSIAQISLQNIETELETKVKDNLSNSFDLFAQMTRDAYQESYIYNRDWFNTKPIPNSILSILSAVALFLGLIVPMYLQLPDQMLLHFLSCDFIFGFILIVTIVCLLFLGSAAYAKSKGGQS